MGGHGAGIAARTETGEVVTLKVGGDADPVAALRDKIGREAPWLLERGWGVLLGHVRRASRRFQASVPHSAAAQPYVTSCGRSLQVVGVHNGYARNYAQLLSQPHVLESADLGPVDSEILPHLLEELLDSGRDFPCAIDEFVRRVRGGNAVCFLICRQGSAWVAVVHRGKTRGLTVWENSEGELVLVSRPRCLGIEFRILLERGGFREVFRVGRRETARFSGVWQVWLNDLVESWASAVMPA